MGLDFGKLAARVGGSVKEVARNGIIEKGLELTGQGAMNGQAKYAEYEYDANGHIKGVSKYGTEMAQNAYQSYNAFSTGIDGKTTGGLTGAKVRTEPTDFIENYPSKYRDTTNDYNNYALSQAKIKEKEQEFDEGAAMIQAGKEFNDDYGNDFGFTKAGQDQMNNASKAINSTPSLQGMLYNDQSTSNANKYHDLNGQNLIHNNPISDVFTFKLPDWSYADFINERAIWQKGLSSIFDEPGWFYFKIFFDFDTDHGLFGGLLNSKYLTHAVNSAAKYLYTTRKLHRYIKPQDRINSLYKFASILSYINSNAPWYFKSIKGLNKAAYPIINDFSKENSIELEVTQDAIDMRLSTLMSLYNYACFDSLTDREIIPANLRKFNMSVIIFQTPLRYLHTSYTSNKKTEFLGIDVGGLVDEVGSIFGKKKKKSSKVNYKTMKPDHGHTSNFGNTMSMKVYSFCGCEFDSESFSNIIPGSISNETPFQMGNSSIKITYTSCTEHTMNEFYAMMFGADGFYFNQYSNYQLTTHEGDHWNGYVNNIESEYSNQLKRYEDLYNTFEDVAQGGTILGLVDSPKTYKKAIDATEAIMNGLFDNPGMLKGLATNFALGLLGSSKDTKAPQGNIYGDYDIGSAYYKDKLEMLKNGVHEHTMAPYYYDPDTGARVDFHKDKQYSAYNYKNDVSTIKNFNVTNWLDTQTQKAASWINNQAREGLSNLVYGKNQFTEQPYKPNQYNKDTAQETDTKKWEGMGKSHDMVDDPTIYTRVEKPYNYDPKEAINIEQNKITKQDSNKNQTMVDNQNEWNRVEKPYNYDPKEAINIEQGKIEKDNKTKNQTMVDDQSTQSRVEKPFNYDPKNAVDYENSKTGGQYKIQNMVDKIGNDEHQVTEKPFNYDPKNAIDYENNKAGGQYKIQNMVDKIGNLEHEVTETPFNYDPKNAVDYENSKAGGQYKMQNMVDKIGNSEHEVTEQPFNYEPKNAVDYENSKAGGQYKMQNIVDKIGNSEHEVTEQPFNYDPKNAVDYENNKAGGEYKSQDMINNNEHNFTVPPYSFK